VTRRYQETYDVYVERDGIWTIEFMGEGMGEARRVADSLMQQPRVTGMRLIRSRTSEISGTVTEDILVERAKNAAPKEPTVGAVQDAPECNQISDILRPRARHCIHLLFREWIEAHDVGVLECVMTPRLFDQLLDRGSLVEKAVHRIAALQTVPGEDTKPRVDALVALIDDVRRAGRRHQAKASEALFVLNHLEESEGLGAADAAIAAFIVGRGTRFAKMMRLIALLGQVESPAGLAVVDRWLSDYMMDHTVSGELAGGQSFAIDRLDWIARMATGGVETDDPELGRLSNLIRTGVLGETRDAMILSLDHALRQDARLADGTPPAERSAILRLIRRCTESFPEFLGGPRLAARLTDRFGSLGTKGGSSGFAEAMETITVDLDTCPQQISYLTTLLAGSKVGAVRRRLLQQIDNALRLYGGLEHHLAAQATGDDVATAAEALADQLDHLELGPKSRATWSGAIRTAAAAEIARRGH
jgi:hypothetical protein